MSGVAVEPPSQPLTGEALVPISANCRDDAWADIHAREFWVDHDRLHVLTVECSIPMHL